MFLYVVLTFYNQDLLKSTFHEKNTVGDSLYFCRLLFFRTGKKSPCLPVNYSQHLFQYMVV